MTEKPRRQFLASPEMMAAIPAKFGKDTPALPDDVALVQAALEKAQALENERANKEAAASEETEAA